MSLAQLPRFPVPKANIRVACKSIMTLFPFTNKTVNFGASLTGKEVLLIMSADTKLTLAPLSKRAEVTTKDEKTTKIPNYNIVICSSDEIYAF